jgi:uncharacterized damage-inducible protein DinB
VTPIPSPSPPDRRRIVGMLATTPTRLRRLLANVAGEQAARSPRPEDWAALEVLRHLLAGDRDTFLPRLHRIAAEDRPAFAGVREPSGPDGADAGDLLDAFAETRGRAVAFLEALEPAGWLREVTSPSRGRLTVEAYAVSMVDHDREHMRQLNGLRLLLGLRALRCEAGDPMPVTEILGTLGATADRLVRAVGGLGAATLRRRPAEQEWSVMEVVAHLASVEARLFLPRLVRMRDEDWPRFAAFDPDAWAAERDWREADLTGELERFGRARAEALALLQGLDPGQLDRVGYTPAFGLVTIHEYATHMAEHDTEHLEQLEAARDGHGPPPPGAPLGPTSPPP